MFNGSFYVIYEDYSEIGNIHSIIFIVGLKIKKLLELEFYIYCYFSFLGLSSYLNTEVVIAGILPAFQLQGY